MPGDKRQDAMCQYVSVMLLVLQKPWNIQKGSSKSKSSGRLSHSASMRALFVWRRQPIQLESQHFSWSKNVWIYGAKVFELSTRTAAIFKTLCNSSGQTSSSHRILLKSWNFACFGKQTLWHALTWVFDWSAVLTTCHNPNRRMSLINPILPL